MSLKVLTKIEIHADRSEETSTRLSIFSLRSSGRISLSPNFIVNLSDNTGVKGIDSYPLKVFSPPTPPPLLLSPLLLHTIESEMAEGKRRPVLNGGRKLPMLFPSNPFLISAFGPSGRERARRPKVGEDLETGTLRCDAGNEWHSQKPATNTDKVPQLVVFIQTCFSHFLQEALPLPPAQKSLIRLDLH